MAGMMPGLVAATRAGHSAIQWVTLLWVVGAVVAAALVITVIVVVSRRPKSMEDGIAEFSRSLQAVAPAHRPAPRPAPPSGPSPASPPGPGGTRAVRGVGTSGTKDGPLGAARRETEAV